MNDPLYPVLYTKMRIFLRLFNSYNPISKLGRWHIHYVPQIVNTKIDQANTDHCGVCHITPQADDSYLEPFVFEN
jgi:hypothetical protein